MKKLSTSKVDVRSPQINACKDFAPFGLGRMPDFITVLFMSSQAIGSASARTRSSMSEEHIGRRFTADTRLRILTKLFEPRTLISTLGQLGI
jgi:hypothetical protein